MPTTICTIRPVAENLDRAGGREMRLHLDRDATGGVLSVLTCALEPATAGPPLHVHPATDETFIVLEGVMLLHTEGQTHSLAAGSSAFVPRGTRHTFATPPAAGVRFFTIHTPGGFEQMHREVHAAESAAGHALTVPDIIPIAAQHDWVLVGPPLLPTGELAVPTGATR